MAEPKTRDPLHPALTHFPIALWTTGIVFDFVSFSAGNAFVRAAFYVTLLGCLMAVPTALAGLVDFSRLHSQTQAKREALTHALIMAVATILFCWDAWLRSGDLKLSRAPGITLGLSIVGFVVICVGGWWGHRLVFHYGAHVMLPKEDRTNFRAPIRPQAPVQP